MKELVNIARNSINDSEGFLNGVFKGAASGAAVLIILSILTGYLG